MKNKMQWEKRNGLQRQSETKYKGKKKTLFQQNVVLNVTELDMSEYGKNEKSNRRDMEMTGK